MRPFPRSAAPFLDYLNCDGLFAKARVVLIDGKPFACHLASSEHWMVHYLNAQMESNAARRATEAAWMAEVDEGFAKRQSKALKAIEKTVRLDYFEIGRAHG